MQASSPHLPLRWTILDTWQYSLSDRLWREVDRTIGQAASRNGSGFHCQLQRVQVRKGHHQEYLVQGGEYQGQHGRRKGTRKGVQDSEGRGRAQGEQLSAEVQEIQKPLAFQLEQSQATCCKLCQPGSTAIVAAVML